MNASVQRQSLKCKVSSDLEDLEKLHSIHSWVPGRDSIRPTPEQKEIKLKYMDVIRTKYRSEADYVLQTVFGFPPSSDPSSGLLMVEHAAATVLPRRKVFDRQAFPYQMPEGTRHAVMWYTYTPAGGDDEVNRDIDQALLQRCGRDPSAYDFVWYANPKMTIPEVYHVQVFWHRT